jgi:hypothetical protein
MINNLKKKKLKVKIFENKDDIDVDNSKKIMIYESIISKCDFIIDGLTKKIDIFKINEEKTKNVTENYKSEIEILKNKLNTEEKNNKILSNLQKKNEEKIKNVTENYKSEIEILKNKLDIEEKINKNLGISQNANEKEMEIMEKKMGFLESLEKERNFYKKKYEEILESIEKEINLI